MKENKTLLGYRVYSELTDNAGNVVHRTPRAWTGNKNAACAHARAWSGGFTNAVYEIYSDGTEIKIYSC